MDTTSHNVVWEVDTLGINGSYLNDVWVVDENNIWVVGRIVKPDPDSSFNGTGKEYFNVAHWDGNEWELIRAIHSTPLNSIYYFSDNDIWVCSGVTLHWNGEEWEMFHLWDMGVLGLNEGGVTQVWGTSSSNIYFVGIKGTIVHYDGNSFEKMESGTDVDLTDIWGISGSKIWVAGRDNNGSVILNYDGNEWRTFYEKDMSLDSYTLPQQEILLSISSIWTNSQMDSIIAVGAWGVFTVNKLNSNANWSYKRRWDNLFDNTGYPLKTRGRSENDIFVCGKRGHILHFNGKSWIRFDKFYEPGGFWITGIDFSENIAYFVGSKMLIKAITIN